jgi:hypothetical protein
MKQLIKKTLIASVCAMALSAQAHAFADEVRLVITPVKAISGEVFADSTLRASAPSGCVTSPDGVSFCLSTPQSNAAASSAKKESAVGTYYTETIPSNGYDAQYIADLFNRDGRFGLVEVDVETSGKPVEKFDYTDGDAVSNAAPLVNDTKFAEYQEGRYFAAWNKSSTGSDIVTLWNLIGMPSVLEKKDPLDLLIIDSEFEVSKDTPYDGGRSFTTTALTKDGPFQLPGNDFGVRPEVDDVCDTHGMGVTAVAAGKANNAFGSAGVTNNVNIHALRSMTCGTGFLSDSANALLWLAGKPFKDSHLVAPYTGKAGVVNMSLGSKSDTCPVFMQTAIDAVREKGFTVVVSAGNEGQNTAVKSPANCQGVIVVGSVDTQGAVSSFSNTGAEVDVMAQGEWMPQPCEDNDASDNPTWCYGSGTSFSTPVVSGVLATVKQQTGAVDAVLKAALQLTSSPVTDARCADGKCGAGLLNAAAVYAFAKNEKEGKLNFMSHALADKSKCEQEWLLDNFGSAAPICRMYKVTLFNNYAEQGDVFKVFSIADGESFATATPTAEGEFTQSQFMMSDVKLAGRQYGVQLCRNGSCMSEIMPINTAASATPAACE